MSSHKLTFELPTSINKMYAPKYGGGVRLSDEARNWKLQAQAEAYNQWGHKPPLVGKLSIIYSFYGTKMDWDNGCKVLGDAMNKIVYKDDSQIIQAHVYMYRSQTQSPRVEVQIEIIG